MLLAFHNTSQPSTPVELTHQYDLEQKKGEHNTRNRNKDCKTILTSFLFFLQQLNLD